MQNGTSRIRASVRASSVFPEPVGPISRMLLFSISTSRCSSSLTAPLAALIGATGILLDALVMIVHRHCDGLLGLFLPDHILVKLPADLRGLGDIQAKTGR